MVLEHRADPNWITGWGHTALHQAVRRDNSLEMIELLLDYGADPALLNRDGTSAIAIAVRRGRVDALDLFERGYPIMLPASTLHKPLRTRSPKTIHSLTAAEPSTEIELIEQGEHCSPIRAWETSRASAICRIRREHNRSIAKVMGTESQTQHFSCAAWRAWPEVVAELTPAALQSTPPTLKAAPRFSSPSKLAWIPTGPSSARPIPFARCSTSARLQLESNSPRATTKSTNCSGSA